MENFDDLEHPTAEDYVNHLPALQYRLMKNDFDSITNYWILFITYIIIYRYKFTLKFKKNLTWAANVAPQMSGRKRQAANVAPRLRSTCFYLPSFCVFYGICLKVVFDANAKHAH